MQRSYSPQRNLGLNICPEGVLSILQYWAEKGGHSLQNVYTLSAVQVVSLVSSSFLPLTFWFFPQTLTYDADLDAFWALLVIIFAGLVSTLLQGWINRLFPSLTGAQTLKLILGTWIGNLINVMYVIAYLLFLAVCMYFFEMIIHITLHNTPTFVVLLALVVTATVGAFYGVESLARVAAIIHPLTGAAMVIIFFLLFSQGGSWYGLPYGEIQSWTGLLHGVYDGFPIFFGLNLFLMINPNYEHHGKNSLWLPLISLGIASAIVIVAFLVTVLALGWQGTKLVEYPIPFVLRLIRLPGSIVENVGILVIMLSTFLNTLFISNHFWAISALVVQIVNRPIDQFRYVLLPVVICCLGIATWMPNETMAFLLLNRLLVPISWVVLLVVPAFLLIAIWFRRYFHQNVPPANGQRGMRRVRSKPSRSGSAG